jgi:hypothetical protein
MVHVTSAEFSSSKTFTDSFGFSGTDVLSSTGEFTSSASISASDLSGKTSIFTFSGYNRLSRNFTETKNVFSPSNLFSVSNEMTETSVFSSSSLLSLSEIFHFSKQITRSRPFAKSGVFGKTRALSLSMAVKGSSFFSRTDTFTDSVWSLIPSDRFVGTVGFDRTSEFYATDDVFTNSTAFDGTLEFARTAALQRSAYPDLESVWGYLMACVALMGLGTALLMRGLILLQKLGAGLHIQSDVGEASSDYTDDSSDEMSDLNWEM